MRSTREIAAGETISKIPDSALLSLHTACNPTVDQLLDDQTAEFEETAVLIHVVAYERSIGKASKWAPYFNSMPEAEDIPILWNDQELTLLQVCRLLPV